MSGPDAAAPAIAKATTASALVVPPQAAILAVGSTGAEGVACLSLSCDQRVLDGAPAAVFLRAVVDRLESSDGEKTTANA